VKRTVITCDNCGNEEAIHAHARTVTVVMTSDGCSDPGIDDMGLPFPSFDLCGMCAAAMRVGLLRHNPNGPKQSDPDPKDSAATARAGRAEP
jgi:hypothetical protein